MGDIGGARARGGMDLARFYRAELLAFGKALYGDKIGFGIQRGRAFAHHFHAIVLGWVVRGGDFDAAIRAKMAGGVIHFFGAAEAKIKDIGPARHQASAGCLCQFKRRRAAIATDDDRFGAQRLGKSAADVEGNFRCQIIAHHAADVIGLKTRQQRHGHGFHQGLEYRQT